MEQYYPLSKWRNCAISSAIFENYILYLFKVAQYYNFFILKETNFFYLWEFNQVSNNESIVKRNNDFYSKIKNQDLLIEFLSFYLWVSIFACAEWTSKKKIDPPLYKIFRFLRPPLRKFRKWKTMLIGQCRGLIQKQSFTQARSQLFDQEGSQISARAFGARTFIANRINSLNAITYRRSLEGRTMGRAQSNFSKKSKK